MQRLRQVSSSSSKFLPELSMLNVGRAPKAGPDLRSTRRYLL